MDKPPIGDLLHFLGKGYIRTYSDNHKKYRQDTCGFSRRRNADRSAEGSGWIRVNPPACSFHI